ncbi:hypothetical protein V5P93_002163 [Actinokineospora auranticolor]|uniref:Uncharacterized protein n=1 Tax=Actinokineospora auranticolor TaxID=155976 RepID=A0A2S6GBM6_9PSEU|nr:hypothetical protein [Actinokineospora auranticolor]PPK61002.1 hypothetical protein CLV40_14516 [Actinokineospora auranticolor]
MTIDDFSVATVINTVDGDTQVGQQIGVVYGDNTVHRHEYYHYNSADPPERKLEVAINHLRGRSSARIAEEILAELVKLGHIDSKTLYYYALALLSGRSINDLDRRVRDSFSWCRDHARTLPLDSWLESLDVVAFLVDGVVAQGLDTERDKRFVAGLSQTYAPLPEDRRDEIATHLEFVLSGAIQDHLDAVETTRIAKERMGNDRVRRTPLYFEPEPAEPHPLAPAPTPLDRKALRHAVLGAVVVCVGAYFTVSDATAKVLGVLAALLCAVGGLLVLRFGHHLALRTARLRASRTDVGLPAGPAPDHTGEEGAPPSADKFATDVRKRVDQGFNEGPGGGERLRALLAARLVVLFRETAVEPARLLWLTRWHARRAACGTGIAPVPDDTVGQHLGMVLGIAIYGLGTAVGPLWAGAGWFWSALLIAGGWFAGRNSVDLRVTRHRDGDERERNLRLFDEERREHARWVAYLAANRPDEHEIAHWFDLDRSYLRSTALKRSGLTNRDLFTHVILATRAPYSRRARVLHGPPRYTEYHLHLFLLTDNGVRVIRLRLNFLTGEYGHEKREVFHYDKVASARVEERGTRVEEDHPGARPNRGRGRTLEVTLVNGKDIAKVTEQFEAAEVTDLEGEDYLIQLATETSGISWAQHVLEAVAAEGREWISKERTRRHHRFQQWRLIGAATGSDDGAIG